MKYRLNILTTHPIQYYSAWFRHLTRHVDLEVSYVHRQDARAQAAAGFSTEFEWDTPLLDGYSHRWLNNVSSKPGVGSFGGCDTPELADLVSQRRPHAWLILGWNYKSALQGIRACRRQGIPVLMRGDSQLPAERALWKRTLKFLPYRLLLPRLEGHLYVGRRNRDYLTYYGVPAERLFFCPHSVDNRFFAKRADQAESSGLCQRIRADLGIPDRDIVLVFAGKLIPPKRPADLIGAMRRLEKEHWNDTWLIVVGSGPLEAEMRRLAAGSQRIHFLGFQNQSRMPAYYRAADAMVLTSGSETWGLVVNEAMACGLPAIVSDRVGCGPDLIQEGRTGLIYPCGDIEALAKSIKKMRRLLRRPGEEMRASIENKISGYSLTASTEGLLAALETVTRMAARRGVNPAQSA